MLTKAEESSVDAAVCVRALQMCACARETSHSARDYYSNNPERFICSPRAFGQSVYENVDSAKIKVPFYTPDIDILRVASMHRIVIHCIDISIHIDESLHP